MSDTVDECTIQLLNERLKPSNLSREHSYVKALILYWDESSDLVNSSFREEGRSLGQFLEAQFNYDFEEFAIPKLMSQLRLQHFIVSQLVQARKAAKPNEGMPLLIIHYGGHGDPNDDLHKGQERRAVWTA
jgi:hypothetical protein